MLKLISNEEEIASCQEKFKIAIQNGLQHEELTIGFQGGKIDNEVYYDQHLWYSSKLFLDEPATIKRYWNAFGLGKRENGNQIIVVEINPLFSGATKRVAGLFAKDEMTKDYFILHRGKIGGGRKGIGKKAFKNWYRGKWVKVYDELGNQEEAILISSLKSKYLSVRIRDFVKEVASFKQEVTSGKTSRSPQKINKSLSFDPEFYGSKKGKRKSKFEYKSYHGLVVNSLDKQVESSNFTFNSPLIDLAVQEKGKIVKIYEVKTSSDRQSIYTGVGQLMFHAAENDKIEKVLVLPEEEYQEEITGILAKLNIKILTYTIVDGEKVRFKI